MSELKNTTRNIKALVRWRISAEMNEVDYGLTEEALEHDREMFVRHVEFVLCMNYPSHHGAWKALEDCV